MLINFIDLWWQFRRSLNLSRDYFQWFFCQIWRQWQPNNLWNLASSNKIPSRSGFLFRGGGTFNLYAMKINEQSLLADLLICLFYHNSRKCDTLLVKHVWPLLEMLLPITILNLIGNWQFKYSHTPQLSPCVEGRCDGMQSRGFSCPHCVRFGETAHIVFQWNLLILRSAFKPLVSC